MAGRIAFLFARPRSRQAQVDGFEDEWLALDELDQEVHHVDFEALVDGEADQACRRLPRRRTWVYRGWMLTQEEYEGLAEAIDDRGGRLLVDPQEYADAAYVPGWFPAVADCSPPTRWIDGADLDEAWEAACELGPPPWVVKDHVKSAKELWHRACFVPGGADRAAFDEVCLALIEARGERFERGLVIRKYVQLAGLGYALPERPVADEHRLFFVDGKLAAHAPYHDVEAPPLDAGALRFLGRRVDSPFFSADVARLPGGGHTVIEINDGGVSTIPATMDPRLLYQALLDAF